MGHCSALASHRRCNKSQVPVLLWGSLKLVYFLNLLYSYQPLQACYHSDAFGRAASRPCQLTDREIETITQAEFTVFHDLLQNEKAAEAALN